MVKIKIVQDIIPEEDELVTLYDNVGWVSYTKDRNLLNTAIQKSLKVITAWDGERLVGLARAVGDGITILYIQDILIRKEYQRKGIGTELIKELLTAYQDVRQKVLITDRQTDTIAFYHSLGFLPIEQYNGIAFACFESK
ncbi:MAG: family N-acetyltransferase [Herbinix sp.]|jgi:ribosomal protein S18 acetylase RimI-like enzyme|nr:family N-acetyltransferase [Herbinix sp.]